LPFANNAFDVVGRAPDAVLALAVFDRHQANNLAGLSAAFVAKPPGSEDKLLTNFEPVICHSTTSWGFDVTRYENAAWLLLNDLRGLDGFRLSELSSAANECLALRRRIPHQ
jgi:hypothetical protein